MIESSRPKRWTAKAGTQVIRRFRSGFCQKFKLKAERIFTEIDYQGRWEDQIWFADIGGPGESLEFSLKSLAEL